MLNCILLTVLIVDYIRRIYEYDIIVTNIFTVDCWLLLQRLALWTATFCSVKWPNEAETDLKLFQAVSVF